MLATDGDRRSGDGHGNCSPTPGDGKTWWQWVLLSSTAVYHVIADTRAASVVTTFLAGERPAVWVADRYGGQLGHGGVRQMCLAHLLRDAKYAIEAGDTGFAPGFRLLLLRAVAIGQRRDKLKDTTLAQYSADLERRLNRLLSGAEPIQPSARRLFRAMRRDRDDLFRFVTRRRNVAVCSRVNAAAVPSALGWSLRLSERAS
jgi:transposase